jgi:fluoroacetyl-CoA thioesterase
MRPVKIGAKGEFGMHVSAQHLANQFKDPLLPPVLATPVMIMMMENAALNAIRPFLEPGESAVGTIVNVQHLAATPVGQMVQAYAEVTEWDGRRVAFTVSARDEREEIGKGTHERMVIDLKRFGARLAAKAAGTQ